MGVKSTSVNLSCSIHRSGRNRSASFVHVTSAVNEEFKLRSIVENIFLHSELLEVFIDKVSVMRLYRGQLKPSLDSHIFLRLSSISALLGATNTSSRIFRRDLEFVFAGSATRKSHFLKNSIKITFNSLSAKKRPGQAWFP